MKKIAFLASFLVFLLVSCSSTSWMKDPYSKYPRAQYVCAVGYGKTAGEAELEAKVNLASLFGTAIEATTTRLLTETTVVNSQGRDSSGYGEYFSRLAEAKVNMDKLFGLGIAERRKTHGGWCALALIDRNATKAAYEKEMSAILDTIHSMEDKVSESSGTFRALGMAVEIERKVEEYNLLVLMYNYLTGKDQDLYNLSDVYALIDKSREDIVVAINTTGDHNGMIESAVKKALSDVGLAVTSDETVATAICSICVNWTESQGVGIASGFVFEQYNVEISLVDARDNLTLYSYSKAGKEGHSTYEGAKLKVMYVTEDEIAKNLAPDLKDKYCL